MIAIRDLEQKDALAWMIWLTVAHRLASVCRLPAPDVLARMAVAVSVNLSEGALRIYLVRVCLACKHPACPHCVSWCDSSPDECFDAEGYPIGDPRMCHWDEGPECTYDADLPEIVELARVEGDVWHLPLRDGTTP